MSKRFREIVSVETIVDDVTGKRYVGIVDSAFIDLVNELHEENQILRHELLCKQLDKAPTEPINCKCHYEVKE